MHTHSWTYEGLWLGSHGPARGKVSQVMKLCMCRIRTHSGERPADYKRNALPLSNRGPVTERLHWHHYVQHCSLCETSNRLVRESFQRPTVMLYLRLKYLQHIWPIQRIPKAIFRARTGYIVYSSPVMMIIRWMEIGRNPTPGHNALLFDKWHGCFISPVARTRLDITGPLIAQSWPTGGKSVRSVLCAM